jgi:hypothetical protein
VVKMEQRLYGPDGYVPGGYVDLLPLKKFFGKHSIPSEATGTHYLLLSKLFYCKILTRLII